MRGGAASKLIAKAFGKAGGAKNVVRRNDGGEVVNNRSKMITAILAQMEGVAEIHSIVSQASTQLVQLFNNISQSFEALGERGAANLCRAIGKLCMGAELLAEKGMLNQGNTLFLEACSILHHASFSLLLSGRLSEHQTKILTLSNSISSFISQHLFELNEANEETGIPENIQNINILGNNNNTEKATRAEKPTLNTTLNKGKAVLNVDRRRSDLEFRANLLGIWKRISNISTHSKELMQISEDFARSIDQHNAISFEHVLKLAARTWASETGSGRSGAFWKTVTPEVQVKAEIVNALCGFLNICFEQLGPLTKDFRGLSVRQAGAFFVVEIPIGLMYNLNEKDLNRCSELLKLFEPLLFHEFRVGFGGETALYACFEVPLPVFEAFEITMSDKQFLFPRNALIKPIDISEVQEAIPHVTCQNLFGIAPKNRHPISEADGLLLDLGNHWEKGKLQVFLEAESIEQSKIFLAHTREKARFQKLGYAGVARLPSTDSLGQIWDIFAVAKRWLLKQDAPE